MLNRFILLILLGLNFQFFSQKATISGYLTDASNGEALIGAKACIPLTKQGAVTNTYGFYSLTLPVGKYLIEYRYASFLTITKEIDLTKDVSMNVELGSSVNELNEVEINAKKGENVNSAKLGQVELQMEQIKTLPAFMGEVDVIKAIQLLPGVSSVSEGGQGFYVRGGGPDQNLV